MVSSITEYKSYYEAGEDMTDEEYGQYMRAVHNFAYNDIEPDYSKLTPLVKAALRTVIASVRKNKEDRENGSKGGRPQKAINIEEKPRLLENKNPGLEKTKTNVNENVNENEKENVNTHKENEGNSCVPPYIPDPNNKKINKELAERMHAMVQEHNETVEKDRKVPISNNLFNFSCKEMRELIATTGPYESPANALNALQNFLKVCKSDTWQKSHSWSTFCKHYVDYTPEYFNLERYLNSEPETEDATQKPEYKFFMRMRTDARFHVETFQAHIDDWKAEGRPEGAEYYRLQDAWEGVNAD